LKKLILSAFCLFIVSTAHAYTPITFTDGKWEESFDCDEWSGPLASGYIGCGIERWGNQELVSGETTYWDQMTTSANNPAGTGRGLRQYVLGTGELSVPEAPATAGFLIVFPANQYEIWMRFYVRYQSGFYFAGPGDLGGEKLLYFKKPDFGNLIAFNAGYQDYSTFSYASMTSGTYKFSANDVNWSDFFGETSDGSWHYIEIYMKSETVTEAPFDGKVRMWCDGTLVFEDTAIDLGIFSTGTTIGGVSPLHNLHSLPDFGVKAIDFDDVVIYTTTPPGRDAADNPFIGPIEAAEEPAASGAGGTMSMR